MPLCSARAELLPMKAHFFLFNAGTAPIVPFMPVYAKQLGFSTALVGTIYTILPFTGMLTKPIVGAISDRFRCHKLLFIISIVITIISFFAIMYIPPVEGKLIGEVHCTPVYTQLRFCPPANRTDRYMIDKVTAEHKDNISITCKMECIGTPEFTTEVCSQWGFKHYCSTTQPVSNYIALAQAHALKQGLDPNVGKTANIKSTTTPAPVTSIQDLKLEGALQPYHTDVLGGCLFIRMTGVRDLISNNYQNEIAPSCSKPVFTTCKFECDSPALADIAEDRDLETPIIHYQFWALVLCLILSWMGMAAVVSIGDTLCFGLLGDRPSDYGYQRLWGSVGWGYFAIIAGILVDMFSSGVVVKNYTPVFYLMAVILILDVAVASRIKQTEHKQSVNILKDVSKMLMNVRINVFLLWCIIVGMCTSLIWNFLFWHLENLSKASDKVWMKTLQGALMAVQCFGGELPFFFISSWMLKKIGHVNAMSLVLFAFGIRFLLYSILVDPWWCLPIELLNGLTFGTFYATMASYASIIAPPGTEATIQGMVGAIFEGVGLSSGSFIGGLLFYYMDGAEVFRMYGLIVLSLCCVHICVQLYLGRHGSSIASTSGKAEKSSEKVEEEIEEEESVENVEEEKEESVGNVEKKNLGEFNHSARYASPNDAISMLGDQNELTNS